MKRFFAFFGVVAILILLSACDSHKTSQHILIPTNTPKPSITLTSYSTQTATKTSLFIPTPTPAQIFPFTPTPGPTYPPTESSLIFPPYPTKQVTLEYRVSGNMSYFDVYVWTRGTIFVLYSDGQFITTGKTYREARLSTNEMNRLLSKLEVKGFYSLETNQTHDQTDALYNWGSHYEKTSDGLFYCFVVYGEKARTICANMFFKEYLVPQMKNILEFLDGYTPENLSLYHPDRILIYVEKSRSSSFEQANALPWSSEFPSLETSKSKILYAEGAIAAKIFALLGYSDDWKIVNENGSEFTIIVRPVLPHETLEQP